MSSALRVSLRPRLQSAFGWFGLHVEPSYHSLTWHRLRLLDRLDISLVVDVGANVGQYAQSLRDRGYHEQIVSFEANPDAAALLRQAAAGDATWRVEGYALGARPGSSELHVTVDSLSTSLLKPGSFPRLHPITFWRGFTDPESHEIVQMDGLFVRHGT